MCGGGRGGREAHMGLGMWTKEVCVEEDGGKEGSRGTKDVVHGAMCRGERGWTMEVC